MFELKKKNTTKRATFSCAFCPLVLAFLPPQKHCSCYFYYNTNYSSFDVIPLIILISFDSDTLVLVIHFRKMNGTPSRAGHVPTRHPQGTIPMLRVQSDTPVPGPSPSPSQHASGSALPAITSPRPPLVTGRRGKMTGGVSHNMRVTPTSSFPNKNLKQGEVSLHVMFVN